MGSFVREQRCAGQVDQVRVDAIASDALAALHDVIRKHQVTYAEYEALKAWLIRVGEYGEWPLLLDLFIEHVVEEVVNADRRGAVGTVEGPFYVPGAPESAGEATLSMREDEAGTRCSSRAPSPTSSAPRSGARWSSCGTPTPTATTRSSRRGSRGGTSVARSVPAPTGAMPSTRSSPRRTRSRPRAPAVS